MSRGQDRSVAGSAFRAAFPVALPVMTSFVVIGFSYGLFVTAKGLPGWFAPFMATVIFGGSMEFVAAAMLLGSFAPIETAVVAFMIQARHMFYSVAMLKKYGFGGWKKAYMVYSLCEETFALNPAFDPPVDVDPEGYYFALSLMVQLSWITGAAIGGFLGPVLPFDTTPFGFIMTALFTVILLEQMLQEKRPLPAVIGVVASVVCLFVFGGDSFLVPSLVVMTVMLLLLRRPIEKGGIE
ncbi:MAG: AzlC family ABC transporter permease [archaeon]|nr:AzlC family ABC transporter permease [archaeon]